MIKLPDKPSELIRLAVADLEKVEQLDEYRVDMGFWHEPYTSVDIGKPKAGCTVCLAGAVMAMSLDVKITDRVVPSDFDEDTAHALDFLSDLRSVLTADDMYRVLNSYKKYTNSEAKHILSTPIMLVTGYRHDPEGFKKAMLHNAEQLAAIGL